MMQRRADLDARRGFAMLLGIALHAVVFDAGGSHGVLRRLRLVRQWPLQTGVKFLFIIGMVTPLLLASYRWCVRSTTIGSLLNGPRAVSPTGQGR